MSRESTISSRDGAPGAPHVARRNAERSARAAAATRGRASSIDTGGAARELTPSRRQASIICARRRLSARARRASAPPERRVVSMMIASPAGRGRTSRGAVNGFSAQSESRVGSATRVCVAVALVSMAMLTPARARAQECVEGDRQVRSLHFVGNKTFGDDELSAYVVTTASSFAKRHFRVFGTARCYPVNGLGPDTDAIKLFYRANGFYDT